MFGYVDKQGSTSDPSGSNLDFTEISKTISIISTQVIINIISRYYGLGLWLPELFNRFHDHYKVSNVSATVCEITRQKFESTQQPLDILEFNNSSLNHTLSLGEECLINEISPTVFVNTFIIGASCLIGNVLSALLAKRLGLKSLTSK